MWIDVPVVCHWDKEKSYWSTNDIHDFKHIEEKGYVTFRTGVFGRFSVAAFRYSNIPFQAWEMKPEIESVIFSWALIKTSNGFDFSGSVTLQISASILVVDFNVKDNLVCISQIQNNPGDILNDIVGVYFKLPKLIRVRCFTKFL